MLDVGILPTYCGQSGNISHIQLVDLEWIRDDHLDIKRKETP